MNIDNRGFSSPFQGFRYKLNALYTAKHFMTEKDDEAEGVYFGFHSYRRRRHARTYCSTGSVIMKCVIPKGAQYWTSYKKMEYCSNKIKAVAWKRPFSFTWNYF